jgi:predicted dehydrogenase
MNRREFLHTTAFGLAAAALAPAQEYDRDKRRRVGLIGCGWYGKSDLFRLVQVSPVEIVSLCDVDSQMLSNAADMSAARQRSKKRPRTYSDYRKMLAEKDLDLVLIAPPDHWHALIMIEAAKSGVDIWVQKPISRDVLEGKAMLAAARHNNRVVQVGLQRRSTPHLVEAKERFIEEGKLGKIALVEIYCYYTCARRQIPLIPRRRRIWITMPGLVLLQCGLITAWFTPAAGARLWSMGTALWVTCASTCLI